MPQPYVKYEDLWSRAKSIVRREYPNVKVGTDKYWSIVMGVYKRMAAAREAQ